MKIKILGTGCPKCKKLYTEAQKALAASGVEAELEKVEKIEQILQYGILALPGLIIDEELKSSGRVPQNHELLSWIETAAKNAK
jgi:small redox-active disulfide protein 2